MTTWLDTGFENGLAPGGLGFGSLNNAASITLDTVHARHGTYCMKFAASTLATSAQKNIYTSVMTVSFYVTPLVLPASTGAPIIKLSNSATGDLFQISLRPTGALQSAIDSTNGTASTTKLTVGTTYLVDMLAVATGATWTLDYQISDTNGSHLFTAAQVTLSGQVATVFYQVFAGVVTASGVNGTSFCIDDVRYTDRAADYPIGAHTSNDTAPLGVTPPAKTWVDLPDLVHSGVLYGQCTSYFSGSNQQQIVVAEGATKSNRRIWLTHCPYTTVAPPPNLAGEASMLNSSLLGHMCWPVIDGIGFNNNTTGWPAGGLVNFSDGAMDSTLAAWCTLLNTLPATPVLFRLWREMNLPGAIYGPNGAAVTGADGQAGVNETPTAYIAAWRYVVAYIRARSPWVRFVWCPGAHNAAPISDYAPLYPGDPYVDWNSTDVYVGGAGGTTPILQAMGPFYGGFNPDSGTVSQRPMFVSETQTGVADATRLVDLPPYTEAFTNEFNATTAIILWDSPIGGPYEIVDTPTGYLNVFQGVVNGSPFLGQVGYTPGSVTNGPHEADFSNAPSELAMSA